ncbi:MAG: YbaB/EbfC family nucleoid-associated protein [Helicobacteraceae bacterium]|jgi:DNA-binding YbaB/EbfC family protein|nr:YbaB/EbfC family nucleoid-associated protein [Helicobacteraceae bacterium]
MLDNLNLGNLTELFSRAEKQMRAMGDAAEGERYEAKSGGGTVKVVANGKSEIVDIDIDDSLLTDKESLSVLLIAAINDALAQATAGRSQAAMKMMSDLAGLSG